MKKLNPHLLQINRNFIICVIVSAAASALAAQLLGQHASYLNATMTVIVGYISFFGIFSLLFYFDNRERYRSMKANLIKKELLALISSLGVGEIIYIGIRWPTLYYFLEIGTEPYIASLVSEAIATVCYMVSVTVLLRKTRMF